MIRYLKRKEIDIQKWNACVANSEHAQIFGCSQYLDICFKDWSGMVLNDYEAVFPLAISAKFFISYLSQPYFIRHFGVYSSSNNLDFNSWIKELKKHSSYFNFDVFNLEDAFQKNYNAQKKVYQCLSLNNDYASIKKNYSEGHIRKLKKINPDEFEIKSINDYQVFIDEFKKTVAEKKLNYSSTNLDILLKLMNELPNHFSVISKGVFHNNKIISGAYFVQYQNRLLYLKGFRKMEGNNDGSMFYLFDRIIEENSNQNLILDFGGSNNSNVAQFFRGFGAEDSLYLHLEKNELPTIIRWLKK